MESSILSEVDDTSILRTGSPRRYGRPLNWLRPLASCPAQRAGAQRLCALANIFLHYVLDLWVHQWRRRHASGRVSIVRYADDFVMGFEKAADARGMLADLKDRLAKFGLALH